MSAPQESNENLERILWQLKSSIDNISTTLESFNDFSYQDLTIENRIRYDLFLAYSLNGLAWIYMRTNGEDPSQTVIKTELSRVKDHMSELQFAIERRTVMPKINQGAAKRFVKHGLWDPKNKQRSYASTPSSL